MMMEIRIYYLTVRNQNSLLVVLRSVQRKKGREGSLNLKSALKTSMAGHHLEKSLMIISMERKFLLMKCTFLVFWTSTRISIRSIQKLIMQPHTCGKDFRLWFVMFLHFWDFFSHNKTTFNVFRGFLTKLVISAMIIFFVFLLPVGKK